MSDMFICPTCKRPTQQADNEIIEHLAKEIDRYIEVLIERTKELDRMCKALEQSETCCTEWEKQALDYKAENIALSGDLECTRKALEIAVDALKEIKDGKIPVSLGICMDINDALEQITALEQKD